MGFVEFYNEEDTFIWERFREGNTSAFEMIYERHIDLLANYGNRMCDDKEMVKDAIHDMFIDLWRNRKNLNHTDSIKYYLMKAYRRNLIKKLIAAKKIENHGNISDITLNSFELAHDLSIVESEIERAKIRRLHQLVERLPTRQKEALFLRFYSGLNYTEISNVMEINQQSAYNMVFRALEALRNKMVYNLATLLLLLQIN